jgi:hypothetical protein
MVLLSKGKYIAGLQCPKLLWVHYNRKEWIPEIGPTAQARFEQGRLVGDLAKTLYPDGIQIEWDLDLDKTLKRSSEALPKRKPLFEAGFKNEGVFARADVLTPAAGQKWDIIEVKSSTDVKDVHLEDVAFQKHVYESAGVSVSLCGVLHIDKTYVRRGELEPGKLFKLVDVTKDICSLANDVPRHVDEMLSVITQASCPEVSVGAHCSDPYPCPLYERCWSFLPERNVFTLYYGGRKSIQLMKEGVLALKDIPESFPLSEKQTIQLDCERTGRPYVDHGAIKSFLATLEYPLHFLDFETIGTPIPVFERLRPHQQVPFQYSLRIVKAPGGSPEHYSYLSDGKSDPRPEILEGLSKQIWKNGSIVAYNASFEIGRLEECAGYFGKFKGWFESIRPRFVDLLAPFRSFAYYHPDQKGSASLKAVMPVLTGKGYEHLPIADGGMASIKFLEMVFGKVNDKERLAIVSALEEYCGLDTEGMIYIVDRLRDLV